MWCNSNCSHACISLLTRERTQYYSLPARTTAGEMTGGTPMSQESLLKSGRELNPCIMV